MDKPELISQSEVDNLLLHQKTELKLQEIDKSIGRLGDTLDAMKEHQVEYHRRLEKHKKTVREEIGEDFVTKEEFHIFTAHMDSQWAKFYWTLSGAVAVVVFGGWLLNQYVIVNRLVNKIPTAQVEQDHNVKSQEQFEQAFSNLLNKVRTNHIAKE